MTLIRSAQISADPDDPLGENETGEPYILLDLERGEGWTRAIAERETFNGTIPETYFLDADACPDWVREWARRVGMLP